MINRQSIKTIQYKEGRRVKYCTTFTSSGSLFKIIDYLKNDSSPIIANGIKVVSVSYNDNEKTIKRTMTSPLPQTTLVETFIGDIPINVDYDIAYNDLILVLKAVNPDSISTFFKFTEELVIDQKDDELIFSRIAYIFNYGKQLSFMGDSCQEYDDYFNNNILSFYLELARIANC